MAVTSSLNSIHISPRTPKTPRVAAEDEEDDVELELLNEEERRLAERDIDEPVEHEPHGKKPISAKDKRSMVLLCVLCENPCYHRFPLWKLIFSCAADLIQGVPVRDIILKLFFPG